MKWPPEIQYAVFAAGFPEYARGPVVSWYPREGDTLKLSATRVGVVVALAAGWDLDHLEATMATQTLDWTRPGSKPPILVRDRTRLNRILEDPVEVYLSPEVSSDVDRSYCCLSCWLDDITRQHHPSRSSSRDPADVSLLGELHGTYLSLEEKPKW